MELSLPSHDQPRERPRLKARLGPVQTLLPAPGVNSDEGHVQRGDLFNKAESLAVNYPDADGLPRFECYLDDIVCAFLERHGA